MASPSQIGAAAEREVAYALMRSGWSVFTPLLEPHGRVDLVGVDRDGKAHRIQVKHGRVINGGAVLAFRTCSNTANQPFSYAGQIDLFGVWNEQLDRAFIVPVADAPERLCHLRLTPPANGQSIGVRYAEPYVLGPAAEL